MNISDDPSEPRKRLNVDLAASGLVRVQKLAKRRGRTSAALVRDVLSFFEQVDAELAKGNKIAVLDPNGNLIKEFVLGSL